MRVLRRLESKINRLFLITKRTVSIIIANIGTTMLEAKDSVPAIRAILKQCAIKNHYIHCDAALAEKLATDDSS
jgi:histidine decarboxylase